MNGKECLQIPYLWLTTEQSFRQVSSHDCEAKDNTPLPAARAGVLEPHQSAVVLRLVVSHSAAETSNTRTSIVYSYSESNHSPMDSYTDRFHENMRFCPRRRRRLWPRSAVCVLVWSIADTFRDSWIQKQILPPLEQTQKEGSTSRESRSKLQLWRTFEPQHQPCLSQVEDMVWDHSLQLLRIPRH